MKLSFLEVAGAATLCFFALQGATALSKASSTPIKIQHQAAVIRPHTDDSAARKARRTTQGDGGELCLQQARPVYIVATEGGARDGCGKRFISKVPMFNAPLRYDLLVVRA